MQKDAMRMTEGPIASQMLRFAAPLFLGNLFQQLYNTADALIVGRMLGNDALAAVSATGTLVFLIISLFVGMSAGAGVLISRYFGAQDYDKLEKAVHTNVAFSLAAGLLMTVFGTLFTPTILTWMETPEDVMDLSVTYIRTFFAGSLGLVLYNGLRGLMQAVGDGKNPLKYLIFCSDYAHLKECMAKVPKWFGRIDKAPHVYSIYSEDAASAESFRRFKEDDDPEHLKLLFCIDALNEGVHVEGISGVVLLRPTISPIVYKQQIGRALSASKKTTPIIFDVVNNVQNLYSIDSVREEMQEAVRYFETGGNKKEVVNESFEVSDEL